MTTSLDAGAGHHRGDVSGERPRRRRRSAPALSPDSAWPAAGRGPGRRRGGDPARDAGRGHHDARAASVGRIALRRVLGGAATGVAAADGPDGALRAAVGRVALGAGGRRAIRGRRVAGRQGRGATAVFSRSGIAVGEMPAFGASANLSLRPFAVQGSTDLQVLSLERDRERRQRRHARASGEPSSKARPSARRAAAVRRLRCDGGRRLGRPRPPDRAGPHRRTGRLRAARLAGPIPRRPTLRRPSAS